MSHRMPDSRVATPVAALFISSALLTTSAAFAQSDPGLSLLARCAEQAEGTYVSAFEVTADFTDTQARRLLCTLEGDITGNRADVAQISLTDDADIAPEKVVLEAVALAPGYMLTVFTEADYEGDSRYYGASGPVAEEMRIGSYMVRHDPIVAACGGDRSVKAIIWDRERFTSSENSTPHCLRQDRSSLEDEIGVNVALMGSVHVDRSYKLIVFRDKYFEGNAHVFLRDDADTIVGGTALKVKSYLLVPSIALEGVEVGADGVVLSYSQISSGSHSVLIPRARFRAVLNGDGESRTVQYAAGREGEPWRDLVTVYDGKDGTDGKDGQDGVAGPRGPKGKDGEDGEVGPQGPRGEPGAVGPAGPDGADGQKGDQGEPGKDGTSQVALFDSLTSSCRVSNKNVLQYDPESTSLLICDGRNWITLSFTQASTRVGVPPIEEPSAVLSIGVFHNCAVRDDSTARCWGFNGHGRVVVPADLGPVRQIVAGGDHTCAVRDDGTARCWGNNANGRATVPADLGPVRQIVASHDHTCAVRDDGTARCWGFNGAGRATVPADLGPVRQIVAGNSHTCALRDDGIARCWGRESYYGRATVPADLGPVRQIMAGGYHTCAVRDDGTARCWGENGSGRATVPADLGPVRQKIVAGNGHTCAVRDDGTVRCWGYSGDGQATVPADLGPVRQIVAGSNHTCAVRDDGTARCWGFNRNGEATVPADLGPVRQF